RVAEGTGQEEAAAGDRQDEIGLEAVGRDNLCQLAGRLAEPLPAEVLTLVVHGRLTVFSARSSSCHATLTAPFRGEAGPRAPSRCPGTGTRSSGPEVPGGLAAIRPRGSRPGRSRARPAPAGSGSPPTTPGRLAPCCRCLHAGQRHRR